MFVNRGICLKREGTVATVPYIRSFVTVMSYDAFRAFALFSFS